MSYPILYSATETNFDHNGIGILSACVSCEVTEEANGIFELAMQYPMDGVHFSEIGDRAIIKAKADQFRQPQLFRVYAISKPINGIVTVLAEHISYDLSGIPVKPFSAATASGALEGLRTNAVVDCPFEFWTDKVTSANFKVTVPSSIRSRLGGVAGSILDVYGGEYEFDNYAVKLHNNRGMNRGVSIRYGKNLTDIQQEQNCSNVATGVYPYWIDLNGENLTELPEIIVNTAGTYNFVKIKTLDLSQVFPEQPTIEQIRNYTQKYIESNNIGVPDVSLSVSFSQLEQSEEYKHLKLLERVSLFDTVNVDFPALGVSANAKVVKMVYDVLSNRVKLATLGSVRANIADTIVEQSKEIEKAKKPNFLQKAIENATQWITNGKGYMVAVKDENGNWKEICSLDTPDIDEAVNVWRWNNGGFGFSPNGYNGPYETAITQDGKIVADFITTGSLTASIIKAGILKSIDSETFYLDLENGILKMKATEFSISGKTVEEIAEEKATTAEKNAKDAANQALNDYAKNVTEDIYNLQNQIDGNITTWFYSYVPTTENVPASEWATTELKNQHLGDLFYIVDNQELGGQVYRWTIIGNYYGWQLVEDTEVAKALQEATNAKDVADSKRRVFVLQPIPPYDEGDLWSQGSNGDLMICVNSRESGIYNASDWGLASNYINSENAKEYANEAAQNAVDAQTQTDIFNKLTNNGTLPGLFMKNGQLYINASYLATGIIKSNDGKISIDLTGEVPEPVFNTGISTNGLTVRADEAGAEKLIHVEAKKTSGGSNYGNAEFFSVNGNKLASIYEVFSDLSGTIPVGIQLELSGQDSLHGVLVNAADGSAGFSVHSEGFEIGSFVSRGSFVDGSARSELWTDVINEKSISWEYSNELGKYVLCG